VATFISELISKVRAQGARRRTPIISLIIRISLFYVIWFTFCVKMLPHVEIVPLSLPDIRKDRL